MKVDLSTINNSSVVNIVFYKKNLNLNNFLDLLNYHNLIIAGDGIYKCTKNNFAIILECINNIPYSNTELKNINNDIIIHSLLPKPPLALLSKIIEIFKYVTATAQNNIELMVDIYYQKSTKKFILEMPMQIISSASVKYIYNENIENNDDYIKYLEIHSHNTMSANFSTIDDNDEKNKFLCYYGVIGNLHEGSNIFDCSMNFRIWSGTKFVKLSLADIFEVSFETQAIGKDFQNKICYIVKKSKEVQASLSKSPTQMFPALANNISNAAILESLISEDVLDKEFQEMFGDHFYGE